MSLSTAHKKHYRTLGHNLKPIVTIAGKGFSQSVQEELERALEDHELIKVRLAIADRELRKTVVKEMCDKAKAELIQEIGKVALLFRAAKQTNPKLSNINR
ncbi:MAG: YhbY family RNA-binding protein [Exilibacterium sp.]